VFLIAKRFRFSASHSLYGLPETHPCSRLHGHNYEVELVLGSEQLDEAGFVVDYRQLAPFADYLNAYLDHRHLNQVLSVQPSAELIAQKLYDWCRSSMPGSIGGHVVAVRVSETPNTWAEYRP
jgi:6-pyruvoyltetrahydropterin/6-carboxytetrahydropterin synthase